MAFYDLTPRLENIYWVNPPSSSIGGSFTKIPLFTFTVITSLVIHTTISVKEKKLNKLRDMASHVNRHENPGAEYTTDKFFGTTY
jgi:hypothetical protein